MTLHIINMVYIEGRYGYVTSTSTVLMLASALKKVTFVLILVNLITALTIIDVSL